MSETMVQRLAKVLAELDGESEEAVYVYVPAAKVVIREMREPTEGMLDAGNLNNCGKPSYAAWQAMIDAALLNTTKEPERA